MKYIIYRRTYDEKCKEVISVVAESDDINRAHNYVFWNNVAAGNHELYVKAEHNNIVKHEHKLHLIPNYTVE